MPTDRSDAAKARLSFRVLYRYFRSGGIYRYHPKSRRAALSFAWAYWRKGATR